MVIWQACAREWWFWRRCLKTSQWLFCMNIFGLQSLGLWSPHQDQDGQLISLWTPTGRLSGSHCLIQAAIRLYLLCQWWVRGGSVWNHLQPHNLFLNMWFATIHVTCLSFNCVLLQVISMVEGNVIRKSPKQLLISLAKHLNLNPNSIVEGDKNKASTQRFSSDVTDLKLVQDVLENMDGDERRNYKSLRDKVASCEHMLKKKQWMHWYQEKVQEKKVLGCCISELCFFVGL